MRQGVKALVVIHCPEGGFTMDSAGLYFEQPCYNLPENFIVGSIGEQGMLYVQECFTEFIPAGMSVMRWHLLTDLQLRAFREVAVNRPCVIRQVLINL